jgi:hypothetical protein
MVLVEQVDGISPFAACTARLGAASVSEPGAPVPRRAFRLVVAAAFACAGAAALLLWWTDSREQSAAALHNVAATGASLLTAAVMDSVKSMCQAGTGLDRRPPGADLVTAHQCEDRLAPASAHATVRLVSPRLLCRPAAGCINCWRPVVARSRRGGRS